LQCETFLQITTARLLLAAVSCLFVLLKKLAASTGAATVGFVSYLGQIALLAGEVGRSLVLGRIRGGLTLTQLAVIGVGSQLVVIITGAFTGAVFAAQAYFKFSELGLGSATGPVVSVAMCRELGPVLTALMVSGRVGAAIAAEIGTMRVTEQIDALRTMGVAPIDYLVVPRVIAMLVSMPILVGESIYFGVLASEILTVHFFGVPDVWFREQLAAHTGFPDVLTGLTKGLVFGVLIVMISCHQGLHTRDGAVGVGRATTRAVVYSSLAVLISNLFLSLLLNLWFPTVSLDL
jgi:phospholipid/cholesterol/gamma-HCH transport system permease protein